jgi:anti-sigma factor RsiW
LKTDNAFNCSEFEEHLRAFIDDELPVNIQSAFIEHASACTKCARDLRGMKHTKQMLSNLPRVTVSPEFDFKMKLRIRREYQSARNPWYSARLVFRNNLSKFILIPAAAMVLVLTLAVYHSFTTNDAAPGNPAQVLLDTGRGVELVMDENAPANEEVNYIMEKVTPSDIEQGIMTPVMTGSGNGAVGSQDITLISF